MTRCAKFSDMSNAALLDEMEERMRKVFTPLIDGIKMELKSEISGLQKTLANFQIELDTMGHAVSDNSTKITTLSNDQISTALQVIDQDVYQRKWCLVLTGVPGDKNEDQQTTRKTVLQLGATVLKVSLPTTAIAACHRLSNINQNAAIIIKFVDLSDRDTWISNAGKLKDYKPTGSAVGLSPNLPPVLVKIRKSILLKRANLDAPTRRTSKVKYMPRFPYMKLSIFGKNDILPEQSKESLARDFYGK